MTGEQLPNPLVPADVNLEGLGFIPMKLRVLKSSLFIKSTGDEFKAAFALWVNSWTEIPAGSLPDDDAVLEGLSCSKVWSKVKARALHNWIKCSDGRLYHPVVAELALDAWARRDAFRERQENKDTRQERWRRRVKELGEQLRALGTTPPRGASLSKLEALLAQANASPQKSQASTSASHQASTSNSLPSTHVDGAEIALTEGETETEGETGTEGSCAASRVASPPPASPPAERPSKAERGKRLPKDWVLPKPWGDWALSEYPHWTADTVRQIATRFRNHWTSVTGKGSTKLDWERTWQNWCSDSKTQREHPAPRHAGRNGEPASSLAEEMRTKLGLQHGVIDG
jgi:hypothetical protein